MSVSIKEVLSQTDWELLREQKAQLLNAPPLSPDYENAIAGIINWIDAIQDAVVDNGIASFNEVFGVDDEDDL